MMKSFPAFTSALAFSTILMSSTSVTTQVYAQPYSDESCLSNVTRSFENLATHPTDVRTFAVGDHFEGKEYTASIANRFGLDNHFQGIQRVPGRQAFVVSGGNINDRTADLYLLEDNRVVQHLEVGKWPYWHAGGLHTAGNLLAVPIEDFKEDNMSVIKFYDLSKPKSMVPLSFQIERESEKAENLLFHRFADGRLLVVPYYSGNLDFYLLPAAVSGTRSAPPLFTWNKRDLLVEEEQSDEAFFGGSTINLLQQCDGKMFLISFANDSKTAPVFNGKDEAFLYRFEWRGGQSKPEITYLRKKHFICKRDCNFAASVGAYTTKKGKLKLYATPHFRTGRGHSEIKVSMFAEE